MQYIEVDNEFQTLGVSIPPNRNQSVEIARLIEDTRRETFIAKYLAHGMWKLLSEDVLDVKQLEIFAVAQAKSIKKNEKAYQLLLDMYV